MSRYLSWLNVFSVWALGIIFWNISTQDLPATKRLIMTSIMMFLTAYNVSDIIGRYQSLKAKDNWICDQENDKKDQS